LVLVQFIAIRPFCHTQNGPGKNLRLALFQHLERINGLVVKANLEVEVRPRSLAAGTDPAYGLARGDPLPLAYIKAPAVGIEGGVTPTVV